MLVLWGALQVAQWLNVDFILVVGDSLFYDQMNSRSQCLTDPLTFQLDTVDFGPKAPLLRDLLPKCLSGEKL